MIRKFKFDIKPLLLYLLIFYTPFIGNSQNLYSLHTEWDDDIKEWTIILDEGEIEGDIDMTWRLRNDPREWSYKVDGIRGTIKQKWDNNPNVWELRSGNIIVNISTIWTMDFTSYKITDGNLTIRIRRKHNLNDPIEWEIQDKTYGSFTWYNEYNYDVRDWVIIDELSQEIPFEFKLAAVFISILNSIQK